MDNLFGHREGFYSSVYRDKYEKYDTLVISPTLLRPRSRGSVKLNSTDPFDPPIVDTCYLCHPDDVDTLVAGLKIASRFQDTETFKKYQLHHVPDRFNCPQGTAKKDEQLLK